jgi:hypothetical protein
MRQVFLKTNPDGKVTPDHFGARDVEKPFACDGGFQQSELKPDQVIVKLICLSVMVKLLQYFFWPQSSESAKETYGI